MLTFTQILLIASMVLLMVGLCLIALGVGMVIGDRDPEHTDA